MMRAKEHILSSSLNIEGYASTDTHQVTRRAIHSPWRHLGSGSR